MPAIPPPISIHKPSSGQGGGRVHPPETGGGGDNGRGDGSPDYSRRLHRARLGLLLAMVSISMLFVTVTAVYLFMRHGAATFDRSTGNYIRQWIPVALPVRLLILNTLILLVSSFTIEKARRAVARDLVLAPVRSIPGIALEEGRRTPWLGITIALGLGFLAGQWTAWQILRNHGFHMSTRIPSPFFYILTGAHAVHLAGGLIVLGYAGAISLLRRSMEQRSIVIEISAWYWHFMGILWLYIFALLEFSR
jgi:cytochrome c oxidase subunit 3